MLYRELLKNGHAKNLQDCVEVLLQFEPFLENRHQNIYGYRHPNLCLHGIFRVPVERLHPEVLLDPFEKNLHTPAVLVEKGHGEGIQLEVVRQESVVLFRLLIVVADPSQLGWVVLFCLFAGEYNRLVALQSGALVHHPGRNPAPLRVLLRPGDEGRTSELYAIQPFEIDIATVHDIDGTDLEIKVIEDVHVMDRAVGDDDHRRDVSP